MSTTLRLKKGKDRPVRDGHPWVFSGAIEDLDPGLAPGTIVDLCASDGGFLARGYANPRCAIAVRLLARTAEPIDAAFMAARLEAALAWRRRCIDADTDAYRLVNGEGDRLPGFLVDVYGEFAVIQALTAGAEQLKPLLLDSLRRLLPLRGIMERSSGNVRRQEGLGPIDACAWGEEAPPTVEIKEHGHRFVVDTRAGQKTGFFLDQRENRRLVQRLARGGRVLNAFAYTGSFGVYAMAGGARRVVSVESSARAVILMAHNWTLNDLHIVPEDFVQGDVFEYLRSSGDDFDLIVLDPPALVKQRKDVPQGARAYKDLNLHALKHAAPGALVMTFTCSQHLDADLFRKIIRGAAADAKRDVQVLRALGAGPDHPTSLAHPEGEYLRGLLLRVQA